MELYSSPLSTLFSKTGSVPVFEKTVEQSTKTKQILQSQGLTLVIEVEVRELDEKGNSVRKQIEVDFVVNDEPNRYYVQSAFALPDPEKVRQELRPLRAIPDSFRKIVVVAQDILPRIDEDGIVTIDLRQFLANPHSLEMR